LGARFPGLKALMSQDSTELLKWLTTAPVSVAKALWNSPTLAKLVPGLVAALPKLATGASHGPASLPSPAIGLVAANNGRTLQQADFSGSCVMFSAAGTATVAGGGVYALAFGMPKAWNPLRDPALNQAKGFALISAVSLSAQIPNFGASETLFWGEIM
jgi:hypothetical protein